MNKNHLLKLTAVIVTRGTGHIYEGQILFLDSVVNQRRVGFSSFYLPNYYPSFCYCQSTCFYQLPLMLTALLWVS